MGKKIVRKVLEMLRKLATGKGDSDDEDEEGEEKSSTDLFSAVYYTYMFFSICFQKYDLLVPDYICIHFI